MSVPFRTAAQRKAGSFVSQFNLNEFGHSGGMIVNVAKVTNAH